MTLRLYNTLSRSKDDFRPLRPRRVGLYVCGPTVYDYAHIGNARPVVVFDVLYRLLRRLYGGVTYVRNITDVDDKIIAASEETGEDIGSITERTTRAFHEDMAALGNLEPDHEPKATQHISQMIRLVEALLASGHAYESQGHVLFNVPSWEDYGRLSGHNREELIAGARVEVAPYKKDPADFVLWKPSQGDQPGWDSPWGWGRPGWHLECSAMSKEFLGQTFDIHGGGQDLIFPHHENEIAQSTCAHGGKEFVRLWMHNGYLMAEGEKMSKSLGNFYTVRELLDEFPGEAIRLALLKTHYRQPLDFTRDGLLEAKRELDGFYVALRKSKDVPESPWKTVPEIQMPLEDDLNTPQALARLHKTLGALNREEEQAAIHKGALLAGGDLLGLLQQDPEHWFKWRPEGAESLDDAAIEALIAERDKARAAKDFKRADEIRDGLESQGILLEDGPGGTAWKRA